MARQGGGAVVDRAERPPFVYLALEGGGVLVVDTLPAAGPEVVARLAEGRHVHRLLLAGDTLVLLEAREEALTFDLSAPGKPRPSAGEALRPSVPTSPIRPAQATAPDAVAPPAMPPGARAKASSTSTAPIAHVIESSNGRVVLEIEGGARLTPRSRVQIVAQRLVEKPDLASGGVHAAPSGEVTAVVAIEQVEERRAAAPLGRGDLAEAGDLAFLTDAPLSERLMTPRRVPLDGRVGFAVRPFLGLNTQNNGTSSKPFGALVDLYGDWYLRSIPLVLEASASPVGFTAGASDSHHPLTFAVTGAYTTDYFEIGAGAGALAGNDGPCTSVPESTQPLRCESNNGLTINQVLRIGALDGLSLTWRSAIFSRPDHFVFGVGRGELGLPLTSRFGLFGGGSGGVNGWAFGEFGGRAYLYGAGGPGTLILSASLGYASIDDGASGERVSGPSVAFGMEWRL